jgi:hypothetical protein
VYAGLPSECVDCHLADYEGTTDPDHGAAGFPTTCETCHTPTTWGDADFTHSAFPLVATHATLECSACHSSGVYAGLPSECVDCHLDDYEATTGPDHGAAGFPTTCETCHTPTTWGDADFTHPYTLVGVHATLDCAACHSSGVYAGLPSDCVDCHLDDYNSTVDPNHAAAGFPTTCDLCHRASDADWNQGVFSHPYFPITSGAHRTAECIDCHPNPSNFGVFSCLDSGCHPLTDDFLDKHDEEPGFVYDSAACYSCHPDGQPPEDRARYRMRPSHG